MPDEVERNRPTRIRLAFRVAVIGLAAAGVGWLLTSGIRAPSPAPSAETAQTRPAPLPVPDRGALRATVEESAPIQLVQGTTMHIDPHSLAPGDPLAIRLSLPPDASGMGVKATWLYGDNHDPTKIQAQRTGPGEVLIEYPAALLTPGRHIIELRTDEIGPIPLRRFAFEIP